MVVVVSPFEAYKNLFQMAAYHICCCLPVRTYEKHNRCAILNDYCGYVYHRTGFVSSLAIHGFYFLIVFISSGLGVRTILWFNVKYRLDGHF